MSKRERRKISINTVKDVTALGQISKEELLLESERYEPENYKPLENIDEKVILIPDNKTEVVTIRFTQQENDLLKKCASKNRISKSAFVRAVVLKAINESSRSIDLTGNNSVSECLKTLLINLIKRVEKIEKSTSKIDHLELKLLDVDFSLDKRFSNTFMSTYSSFEIEKILKNNRNLEANYGSYLSRTLGGVYYENEQN